MNLVDFVELRKNLVNTSLKEVNLVGTLKKLTKNQIENLNRIEDCVLEVKDSYGKVYSLGDLDELKGKEVVLELARGQFSNYFEDFSELIERHPYSFELSEYYIHQGEVDQKSDGSVLMDLYRNCLRFISFLKQLSDNKNTSGGELELYFHKIGKSLILPITYDIEDLQNSKLDNIEYFVQKFEEELHSEDRKKLFVNDLVDYFSGKERNFSLILKEFVVVRDNYYHSLDIYLEGFSFEKIKTSSLIYFQEISDKIHETIRKVSNYLFAIPIAFLFLASRLDFETPSIAKNFSLLVLGYLFFILIWNIFFKNIKESLDSVKKEILRFQDKIKNVSDLSEIKQELNTEIKGKLLQNQYSKLRLLKIVTVLIVIVLTIVVCYIHWESITGFLKEVQCQCFKAKPE